MIQDISLHITINIYTVTTVNQISLNNRHSFLLIYTGPAENLHPKVNQMILDLLFTISVCKYQVFVCLLITFFFFSASSFQSHKLKHFCIKCKASVLGCILVIFTLLQKMKMGFYIVVQASLCHYFSLYGDLYVLWHSYSIKGAKSSICRTPYSSQCTSQLMGL